MSQPGAELRAGKHLKFLREQKEGSHVAGALWLRGQRSERQILESSLAFDWADETSTCETKRWN